MISCNECPNKNQDMFSQAAGGKRILCLKCYHSFPKVAVMEHKKYYKTSPVKMEKEVEVPDMIFVEINLIRDRLNKLEEFCKKRKITA